MMIHNAQKKGVTGSDASRCLQQTYLQATDKKIAKANLEKQLKNESMSMGSIF